MIPVLLGGLFIGVLSALPIVSVANCCCLWIVGGGALTVRLAQQQDRYKPIGPGRGALLGLMAGVVGAFVWLIAALLLDVVIGPLQQRMLDEVLRGAQDMPPNARDWLEGVASNSSSPFRFIAGVFFQLFGAAFAALGGVLGAIFFRRDGVPPALGGDTVVPPPLPPLPPLPPHDRDL
jgi:hypothetical protein